MGKIEFILETSFINENGEHVTIKMDKKGHLDFKRQDLNAVEVLGKNRGFKSVRELFKITYSFPHGIEIKPLEGEHITKFEFAMIGNLIRLSQTMKQ